MMIYDTLLNKKKTSIKGGYTGNPVGDPAPPMGFLNNKYIFLKTRQFIHKWGIASISGKWINKDITFTCNGNKIKYIGFSEDLTRAFARFGGDGFYRKTFLIDTTPFRDWLYFQGLIFQPVKGVINTDCLRIRENPNLGRYQLSELQQVSVNRFFLVLQMIGS